MRLDNLCCADCGEAEIISVWPGKEDVQMELFRLIPGRPVRGWCEACWLKRFGPKPALPRRGSRAVSRPLTQV